jgi:hypothetical protein
VSEPVLIAKLNLIASEIKHEDELIGQRTTWLVISQSFLFGTFVAVMALRGGTSMAATLALANSDLTPRLRTPSRVQHHAQDAIDAEPGVSEAGVRQRTSATVIDPLLRHRDGVGVGVFLGVVRRVEAQVPDAL